MSRRSFCGRRWETRRPTKDPSRDGDAVRITPDRLSTHRTDISRYQATYSIALAIFDGTVDAPKPARPANQQPLTSAHCWAISRLTSPSLNTKYLVCGDQRRRFSCC